jgi:ribonuclease D
MMAALAAAEPLPDDELPPRTPRGAPLGKEGALVADLLKLLLKVRSREIDVASRLLARSEELELLAAGVRKNLPVLEGWRYEQFGREAVDLVEGKVAFTVVDGRMKMVHVDDVHETIAPSAAAE